MKRRNFFVLIFGLIGLSFLSFLFRKWFRPAWSFGSLAPGVSGRYNPPIQVTSESEFMEAFGPPDSGSFVDR